MQQFHKFIARRFVSLNMFRAPPRPLLGAYNCINSLWFYRWSVGGSSVVGRGLTDHDQQRPKHVESKIHVK